MFKSDAITNKRSKYLEISHLILNINILKNPFRIFLKRPLIPKRDIFQTWNYAFHRKNKWIPVKKKKRRTGENVMNSEKT